MVIDLPLLLINSDYNETWSLGHTNHSYARSSGRALGSLGKGTREERKVAFSNISNTF